MNDNLDLLLRSDGDGAAVVLTSKIFTYNKREINSICRSLSIESQKYLPERSINSINTYLKSPNKIERIFYSEISNYIFSLDFTSRGIFATNIEKLMLFSLNSKLDPECREVVIRIYDHFQLVLYQVENVNNIFAESIDNVRENLRKDIKAVEKEYISILGIFASIVLAFVGGITFSSSVLQNINSVSIYRLLMVIDLLAFVLVNTIYLLVKFIFTINDKQTEFFKIKWLNISCVCIALIVIFAWLLNVQDLSEFFSTFLPWC